MACPFFAPSEPHDRELWPHRTRLSLGDGFAGHCAAHASKSFCDDETVRLHCNLGYAASCVHLPAERAFDAVRFLVQRENGQRENAQPENAQRRNAEPKNAQRGNARRENPGSENLQTLGSTVLRVQFVCERCHHPALAGELRYDPPAATWLDPPDPRLLRLADAAVLAWIRRHGPATDSTLLASNAMSNSG